MTFKITRVELESSLTDKNNFVSHELIFHTKEWLKFIEATQSAEPLILDIQSGAEHIGRFFGLIVRKFGLKILGSPFPGWNTGYMGIILLQDVPRGPVIQAVIDYAFADLGCVHFEMIDRECSENDLSSLNGDIFFQETMEIDLNLSEEQLFSNMSSKSCRYCIRKSRRNGVRIVPAHNDTFAHDYFSQLCDVFAKQNLVPTYDDKRVVALIEHLLPTGNLLLLRAVDQNDRCIATGIFPALNELMFFWGGASWRKDQKLSPNEAMIWYAMKYWKSKGIKTFDMGGGRGYKRKYGGHPVSVPGIRVSKYAFLRHGRGAAKFWHGSIQKLKGLLSSSPHSSRKLDKTEKQ